MDCSQIRNLLDPYVDNELEAAELGRVNRHLEGCDACREALDEQSVLSASIRKNATYHRAPEDLRRRVRAKVSELSSHHDARPAKRRWSFPQWPRWTQA